MSDGTSASVTELMAAGFASQRVALYPRSSSLSTSTGSRRSPFKSRGMEFSEIRPYIPGDDARNIDWRQSAKRGKTYTKVFSEEKQGKAVFVCDIGERMFFGTRGMFKSVLAAKTLARIVAASLSQRDKIGGVILNPREMLAYPPTAVEREAAKIFKDAAMATQMAGIGTSLAVTSDKLTVAVRKAAAYAAGHAMLFIISDFYNFSANLRQELLSLRRRCNIALLLIEDAFERDPPAQGCYPARLGNDLTQLDFDDGVFAGNYRAFFRKRREALAVFAAEHGMMFAALTTGDNDANAFRRIFGRKQ